MKIEKAIELMKTVKHTEKKYQDALNILIIASEKQIPKKIAVNKCIHKDWNHCNNCEVSDDCELGEHCPVCNKSFVNDSREDEENYCPECGQKLDWSDEE